MATFSMYGARVTTGGDEEGCRAYLGEAQRALYQLRALGFPVLPERKFDDGTVVKVWTGGGFYFANIYKPIVPVGKKAGTMTEQVIIPEQILPFFQCNDGGYILADWNLVPKQYYSHDKFFQNFQFCPRPYSSDMGETAIVSESGGLEQQTIITCWPPGSESSDNRVGLVGSHTATINKSVQPSWVPGSFVEKHQWDQDGGLSYCNANGYAVAVDRATKELTATGKRITRGYYSNSQFGAKGNIYCGVFNDASYNQKMEGVWSMDPTDGLSWSTRTVGVDSFSDKLIINDSVVEESSYTIGYTNDLTLSPWNDPQGSFLVLGEPGFFKYATTTELEHARGARDIVSASAAKLGSGSSQQTWVYAIERPGGGIAKREIPANGSLLGRPLMINPPLLAFRQLSPITITTTHPPQ